MILLLSLLGLAAAECVLQDVETEVLDRGEGWKRTDTWQLTVGTGHPECRRFHIRAAPGMVIDEVEAVIRQWDDTKTRLGPERLILQDSVGPSHTFILELPELRTEDRLQVRGVRAGQDRTVLERTEAWWTDPGPGPVTSPETDASVQLSGLQVLTIRLPESRPATFGPRGTASAHRAFSSRTRWDGEAVRWWTGFPPGTTGHTCSAEADQGEVEILLQALGCEVRGQVPAGTVVSIAWGWDLGHAPAAEEVLLLPLPENNELRVHAPGTKLVGAGPAMVQTGTDTLYFGRGRDGGHERASWRVAAAAGTAVLPDRPSVLSQIALGAVSASLPEPGVGLAFKDRKADLEAVGEILKHLRGQVVAGTLTTAHPLKPRRLRAVRRSRWGTPWEQALLLTRYLGQLKMDAVPMPVRPTATGTIESAVPEGYTAAVVRVRVDGADIWIDPACAVCAVGELRPGLWGGQVLAADLTALPKNPVSEVWQVSLGGDSSAGVIGIRMEGAAAIDLRRHLARYPLEGRAEQIARWAGLPDARLEGHEGITALGQPVVLKFQVDPARQPEALEVLEALGGRFR